MLRTKTLAIAAVSVAAGLLWGTPALAYTTFYGYDAGYVPASHPNSDNAQAQFLSSLVGVGTEDFEGFSAGQGSPMTLTFPGAGTATLNATAGQIQSGADGAGRFPISGSNYWSINVTSGSFWIDFSTSIAAFGFYGTDLGDFGGDLTLRLTHAGGGTTDVTVPYTPPLSDGSVLYFGLIAGNAAEQFERIDFLSSGGFGGETFGYDDMTIGTLQQVNPAPEPGSLSLVAGALLGLGWLSRRRRA